MSPPALAPQTSRIVIVLPSWVGDVVMSTPVLRATRQVFPNAHVAGVMRSGLAEVLAGNPWLDEMITCDMKGPWGLWRAARAIATTRGDACVLLPNSLRAALATRLAGVPIRVGYKRDGRGWLLTHGVTVEKSSVPIPTVRYYAHLGGEALGHDSIEPRMELFVTDEERSEAQRMLHDVENRYFLLNPGGNKPSKRWPAPRFAKVADALCASHGLTALISGAPSEADVLKTILEAKQNDTPMINLADRGVTLGSLKAIIQGAALMITNDTGPRHMAAALGTPLVTLFGPTDHRWTTIDCSSERIILAEPFLPENRIADHYPKDCRIERIQVEDVIAPALSLLEEYSKK